jgi:lysophospholipase L1-like esterase
VARSARGDAIDVASSVGLRFNGDTSVVIAPGRAAVSDPVDLSVAALSNVTISTFFGSASNDVTGHPGSRTTSYLVPDNQVESERLLGATRTEHWYVLSGAEVEAGAGARAVVILGNSIADGRGSGTDRNDRWPDNLAARLHADPHTSSVAVLNAGIGGNAVLRGGLGPPALERLERDVLSQAGARWVIVSEGVNDIGVAPSSDAAASIARKLIDAYGEIVRQAHARGLRVYGATILPFGGAAYDRAGHDAARLTVNQWIRTSGAFDAVIDLDAALRDPAAPSRLRRDSDSGDHLHPNEHGYRLMAGAIDLELFRMKPSGATSDQF